MRRRGCPCQDKGRPVGAANPALLASAPAGGTVEPPGPPSGRPGVGRHAAVAGVRRACPMPGAEAARSRASGRGPYAGLCAVCPGGGGGPSAAGSARRGLWVEWPGRASAGRRSSRPTYCGRGPGVSPGPAWGRGATGTGFVPSAEPVVRHLRAIDGHRAEGMVSMNERCKARGFGRKGSGRAALAGRGASVAALAGVLAMAAGCASPLDDPGPLAQQALVDGLMRELREAREADGPAAGVRASSFAGGDRGSFHARGPVSGGAGRAIGPSRTSSVLISWAERRRRLRWTCRA
ncbi:MAG: hypothetical protein KatS3mg103_1029 [Phycisphaerales bacterium]|nr:MAG: hypothetical protein KatS3mg103_1029 [Phycisphaerales bacterium]